MESKIVNGTAGTLTDVVYKDTPEGREAVCAYVKVPSSHIALEGLPQSVVPIFPRSVQFTYRPSRVRSVRVSRSQLPLVPAWAFTDYKVQGASLSRVVVDLTSARGIQNAYVMLSRAPSLRKLGVFRWFSSHRIFSRLQEDLRTELSRLAHLDYETHQWFINRNISNKPSKS
ncbi:hypothetical protein L210DRAFT_867440 [Boletus edulis BED1]|uniref:Uncharacterized protein n=1 Tax=Boletus edulis BED1 TaxID=1328754 RepID=A0AAD4BUQ5_BOLED|nr:hypothetical protein L210DRAFT_867440 [Boletus edulis BED1]